MNTSSKTIYRLSIVVLLVAFQRVSSGQACFTAEDMDAATRAALIAAGNRYFEMAARGDAASLKQNSIPAVANNFADIENSIRANQANFSGAHATARRPFLLKAEGTSPLPKAEFLCGVFDARGQTKDSAEFSIPNLPPGNYGIVILDVPGQSTAYTVSFVLQQQGADWKIGGFFPKPAAINGHDSNWFITQARSYKSKGQNHNAWLYLVEGRDLAMPVPFMYTQVTDKLYEEAQSVKPSDFPLGGKTADLPAPEGKAYKLIDVFPYVSSADLDLVAKYQNPDISDSGKTFQENMNVMRALLAKFPELREAFAGIVVRAVTPSGQDYGSMMPMKDIK